MKRCYFWYLKQFLSSLEGLTRSRIFDHNKRNACHNNNQFSETFGPFLLCCCLSMDEMRSERGEEISSFRVLRLFLLLHNQLWNFNGLLNIKSTTAAWTKVLSDMMWRSSTCLVDKLFIHVGRSGRRNLNFIQKSWNADKKTYKNSLLTKLIHNTHRRSFFLCRENMWSDADCWAGYQK